MSAQDDLHGLIHSLSQAEKRYFKIFASRHVMGDKNNYVRLFDELNAQTEYDEDALRQSFKGQKFISRLPSEKNYLLRLVLKSLRAFNDDKSVRSRIENLMQEVDILIDKGVHRVAMRLLNKAIALAREYEYPELLLTLLRLEARSIKFREVRDPDGALESNRRMRREALEATRLDEEMNLLSDTFFLWVRKEFSLRDPEIRQRMATLLEDPLLKSDSPPIGFGAAFSWYAVKAFYAQLQGSHSEAFGFYQAQLTLFESRSIQKEEHPARYCTTLANCLSACHQAGKYEEFASLLKKLEAIRPASRRIAAERRSNLLYYRFIYRLNRYEFAAAASMAEEIRSLLQTEGELIPLSRHLSFNTNLALVFFVTGEWKASLAEVNAILDQEKVAHRKDLLQLNTVLYMVLHYELGNVELMEPIFRSATRKMKRKDRLFDFEKAILRSLRRLPDCRNDKEREVELQGLMQFTEELKAKGRKPAGFEELRLWIRCKLEGGVPADHIQKPKPKAR